MNSTRAFDYDGQRVPYARIRRADPRIAAQVHRALGDCRTIVNVGAGTGSYEPNGPWVLAVEPSREMRSQRPRDRPPAIVGTAEHLPLDDGAVDTALAVLTVHHWPDLATGLRELRRVARGPVVILTFDPNRIREFWMNHYCPEVLAVEASRYPDIGNIRGILGGRTSVEEIPIPRDCTDGFQEAFYARPFAFLDIEVRRAQSAWGFVDQGIQERSMGQLARDLDAGVWHAHYGHIAELSEYHGAFRLIRATPG